MKTSQKILWGGLAACFFMIIVMGFLIRWQVPSSTRVEYPAVSENAKRVLRNQSPSKDHSSVVSLADFDQIMIKNGQWQVNIQQGPKFTIQITLLKGQEGDVLVAQQGHALLLSAKELPPAFDNFLARADITMPTLSALSTLGAAQVKLKNFRLGDFKVNLAGESEISGENNEIKNLALHTAGQSDIDFLSSDVHQVSLHAAGKTLVKLHLVEAILAGDIFGQAKILYTGTLRSNALHTFGEAEISAL
jgi:hypothetical protein